MSFEWKPFTELLAAIVDNRGRTCPVGDAGMPLIATNCIDPGSLYPRYETSRFVSEETYRTWFRGHPLPGDILFVCKGSPGRTSLCPGPVDFCIAQDMVAVRADPTKIAPKYLFAALRSSLVQSQINNLHVGTMIPHFKKGDFGKLRVPVPEPGAQIEIGDFYFEVSRRIALLRETNATLEAIAQALFKSWFIDFDPVRAKSQGLAPPGMDEATAALFPGDLEGWNALGSRPAVDELIVKGALLVGDGYRAKNDELGQPGVAFVRAGDLDGGQITPTKDFLAQPALKVAAGKIARLGDTAFTSKGTIGRFAFVDEGSGEAVYSPQVCFWRSLDREIIEPIYLHYWMKSAAFTEQVNAVRGQAAIMDYVSLGDQRRMRLDLPPIAIQRRFAEVAESLLGRISCNRATAMHLAALRDALLPRLISGQLRLPDAEALPV